MKMRTNLLVGCIVLLVLVSDIQAASIHYSFDEISSGTWEFNVSVSGNTAGLSSYSLWVNDATGVSYVENTLGTMVGAGFQPIGFLSANLLSGNIHGRFDAGNFQNYGNYAITGVGMVPVDEPGSLPGTTPHILLDIPALLGTLTTPAGLGEGDFAPQGGWLLNADNTFFYTGEVTITHEVNSIPEPVIFIDLDIKPGSDRNPLNLRSKGKLPVVVLGSDELDVSTIDLATLLLNGVGLPEKNNGYPASFEDEDGDGILDLVMLFSLQDLGIEAGMEELLVTGSFLDGGNFEGSSSISVVGLGDANLDGVVSAGDYSSVQANFGNTSPTIVTPEPATLSLLLFGGFALLKRRRK